jgi:hypothetical protein
MKAATVWGTLVQRRLLILTLVAVSAIACIEVYRRVPISGAAQAQAGSALAELGIAPITNVQRLVDLGCHDAGLIIARVPPFAEKKEPQSHFRQYVFRGLVVTTETVQQEAIFGSALEAHSFSDWGIFEGGRISLADVARKFGSPWKIEGGAAWFVSEHDETAIVLIEFSGAEITRIQWSCG